MIRLGGEILPFAPAVEVDEGLHAAPFHYFAGEPFEVDGLDGGKEGISSAFRGYRFALGSGKWFRTFVKKSLHPAANASWRSLCNELAVKATMMTGLLKSAVFIRLSSLSGSWSISSPFANVGVVEALFEKTPMLFTRSNRLISLVASRPFITGN